MLNLILCDIVYAIAPSLILTPPGLMSAIANVLFLLSYVMVLRRSDTMFYLSRFNLGIGFSALIGFGLILSSSDLHPLANSGYGQTAILNSQFSILNSPGTHSLPTGSYGRLGELYGFPFFMRAAQASSLR